MRTWQKTPNHAAAAQPNRYPLSDFYLAAVGRPKRLGWAEMPTGASDNVARTATANGRAATFTSQGFE